MTNPEVVKAEFYMAAQMAPNMRQADVDEVWASGKSTPLEALESSLLSSTKAWAWVDEDGPFALLGVSAESALSTVGRPWLLSAHKIESHRIEFAKRCRGFVDQMQENYDLLENWVDARYEISVRWLEWCGFMIHPAQPFGHLELPFHRFTREK